jgi:hypothetical protein
VISDNQQDRPVFLRVMSEFNWDRCPRSAISVQWHELRARICTVGEIRSENSATGPVKVYKAGESFFELTGSKHLVSENAGATEPASLLAIFIADDGATLTASDKRASPGSRSRADQGERRATWLPQARVLPGEEECTKSAYAEGILRDGVWCSPHPVGRSGSTISVGLASSATSRPPELPHHSANAACAANEIVLLQP